MLNCTLGSGISSFLAICRKALYSYCFIEVNSNPDKDRRVMVDEVQVNFRIPRELRDRLKAAAEDSGRTLTAEFVLRLQKSFDSDANALEEIEFLTGRVEDLSSTVDDLDGRLCFVEDAMGAFFKSHERRLNPLRQHLL
jgi:predicted DNA-binding protein